MPVGLRRRAQSSGRRVAPGATAKDDRHCHHNCQADKRCDISLDIYTNVYIIYI
jgi:hypothetical protein